MTDKSARSKEVETELTIDLVKEKIIELGKKRGSLSYDIISEKLSQFELDAEQMDEFYEHLTELGIQLTEEKDEDVDDSEESDKDDDEEFDLNDLSVPPGVKINDP